MMTSSSSIASDDYIFEYKLDNNYNYNYYKYNLNRPISRSYSLGISQPTFCAYETYPSDITVTLNNKQETWVEYIRRQFRRLFGCFSIKVYSEVSDLPVDVDI